VGRAKPDAVTSELHESLAALGQFVVTERSLQESLHRVAELSVAAVYGADEAGVTWVVAGTPTTVSASGEAARRLDEMQYTLDEGPCLDAYRTQQPVLVEHLAGEERWPRFATAALGHGLAGVVATPLTAHGSRLGALNVYTTQSWVFDETSVATSTLFTEQAAIVLANAEAFARVTSAATNLGEALTAREVIGMAKGLVMARQRCDPDTAFEVLRQMSQTQHRKLREVAQDLVAEVSSGSRGGHTPKDGSSSQGDVARLP